MVTAASRIIPSKSEMRSQNTSGTERRIFWPKYSLYMNGLMSSPTRPGLMVIESPLKKTRKLPSRGTTNFTVTIVPTATGTYTNVAYSTSTSPDPNAGNNDGDWSNAGFDRTVTQAEKSTGDARITLYNQAEQIAIQDVGWLPLDHETMAAIIPSWLHGVTLNGRGLFFGDWSNVYLLQH